jgi:hypothetical protein
MHCRQTIQHRDEQLVIRLARPLKRELEEAALRQLRRSTAALVREILVDWAAQRITERTTHEAADLP